MLGKHVKEQGHALPESGTWPQHHQRQEHTSANEVKSRQPGRTWTSADTSKQAQAVRGAFCRGRGYGYRYGYHDPYLCNSLALRTDLDKVVKWPPVVNINGHMRHNCVRVLAMYNHERIIDPIIINTSQVEPPTKQRATDNCVKAVHRCIKTYMRCKTHCITRRDKQTARREKTQQTKINRRAGQTKDKVNERRNRAMLAERIHVSQYECRGYNAQMAEKGQMTIQNSFPVIKAGKKTHDNPTIAMQTPQSQFVASSAFAKVQRWCMTKNSCCQLQILYTKRPPGSISLESVSELESGERIQISEGATSGMSASSSVLEENGKPPAQT
ncbi:hypothetical protein F4604DRAFT_1902184 [Suillus subluteus]|nr:hypothetical protein F4604DRAFT_1902184 [Suillus subluteus]